MAGTLNIDTLQLGDNATAANNFFIKTNADGTGGLYRGNSPTSTSSIVTWDSSGRIAMPQTVVAFSVFPNAAQSLTNGAQVKLAFQSEEFDTLNSFDSTTNFRFQPTVAGYYAVFGGFSIAVTATLLVLYLYKNGAVYKVLNRSDTTASIGGSGLVYLNGSTDYVELYAQQNAATQNTNSGAHQTFFQGHLVAKA